MQPYSSARQIDLESEFEMSRRRADRETSTGRRLEMLERRVTLLEREMAAMKQLLRTAGVDGLYSVQLEGN